MISATHHALRIKALPDCTAGQSLYDATVALGRRGGLHLRSRGGGWQVLRWLLLRRAPSHAVPAKGLVRCAARQIPRSARAEPIRWIARREIPPPCATHRAICLLYLPSSRPVEA